MRRFNITFPGGTHVFNCKIVLFEVLIRGQVPNRKKVDAKISQSYSR
jgi:hypothetical protein